MKTIWFKRKTYGWGWTPSTWQGWLVLLIFFVLVVRDAIHQNRIQHSVSDFGMNFAFHTFVLAAILILVCYVKGEKPKWQWGSEKQNESNQNKQ